MREGGRSRNGKGVYSREHQVFYISRAANKTNRNAAKEIMGGGDGSTMPIHKKGTLTNQGMVGRPDETHQESNVKARRPTDKGVASDTFLKLYPPMLQLGFVSKKSSSTLFLLIPSKCSNVHKGTCRKMLNDGNL